MPRKTKKIRKANKKVLAVTFAAALVITTVITGVVAALYGNEISLPGFEKPQQASVAAPKEEQPVQVVEK